MTSADSVSRPDAFADIAERLAELMVADSTRLGRRLESMRRRPDAGKLAQLAGDVDAAVRRVTHRQSSADALFGRPHSGDGPRRSAVTYPADLPVSEAKDDIAAAIRDHQVVVVAGETGSGKTTQLPKICLELGRGVRGRIGHTQPRRIAARAVAERIAEEIGQPLGEAIGYQVRFTEKGGRDSLVKVMTDGILLAEITRDRDLLAYDTLILDEAHERSLNIDFLLGYLKQLLPRRPDLKLIITSATIDTARFAEHFGGAPVVAVSGRTYPVEVRYRPLLSETADDVRDEPRDSVTAICEAVEELYLEGAYVDGPRDILVFLSGEREIRDATDALRGRKMSDLEVVPLYARLSAAEQHRVFEKPPPGMRRVVLATNVAETSLTVPGIRYVVDPGTARVSRYSFRLKVQRLPIEAVSQASANQRAGRCGRLAPGVCIRLYSEEDFLARPEFTDPEILRTNLASVILRMTALGFGDIAAFPFVEPPDKRQVRDGIALLEELGALATIPTSPADHAVVVGASPPQLHDQRRVGGRGRGGGGDGGGKPSGPGRLTKLGRQLSELPLDPRFGRMVLEAERNGCLAELLVLTSALSIQDPRERLEDKQQAADEQHVRFRDKTSDFAAYLNLWNYLQEQQRDLSSSAFRRRCKAEYLHYLRVREWQDLHAQLLSIVRGLGLKPNTTPGDAHAITLSLLSGLLSHIGLKDEEKRDYLGARGARFNMWPGSALARKPPAWVMAAELVETSRLWGRVCARIAPEDVEPLAEHLLKRTYSEPHWSKKQASVMAYERVTLYGLPIVARRPVTYGRIDPAMSRDLFLRHALVEGDWETTHDFFAHNRQLLDDVEELEHRVRRRGLVVDDDTLFAFYDARVPESVVSGAHFDKWWKRTRRETPDLLTFDPAMLLDERAGGVSVADFPDVWRTRDGPELPLSYEFDPKSPADGVTVHVPVSMLNQLVDEEFEWLVPGLRLELVTSLLRGLPKEYRRSFVPVPDTAAGVLDAIAPYAATDSLYVALEQELHARTGVVVDPDAWQPAALPPHLRMTFRVEDGSNPVAHGKDLDALQVRLRPKVRAQLAQAASSLERTGLTDWSVGELPRTFAIENVQGFPALVDDGEMVSVRVLTTPEEQAAAMARGIRRLLRLTVPSPMKPVLAGLSTTDKLALSVTPHGSVPALLDDCLDAAIDELVARHGGPVWTEPDFRALRNVVRGGLADVLDTLVPLTVRILAAAQEQQRRLRDTIAPGLQPAKEDIQAQLSRLVFPGFVAATGTEQLQHLPRYLRAVERRLEALPNNPSRDATSIAQVQRLESEYAELVEALPRGRRTAPEVVAIRWMLEELRVSLFAQNVGTPKPVSEKRILRAMDDAVA